MTKFFVATFLLNNVADVTHYIAADALEAAKNYAYKMMPLYIADVNAEATAEELATNEFAVTVNEIDADDWFRATKMLTNSRVHILN